MKCIQCDSFSLQKAGDMAKLGFGCCAHAERHVYFGARYERECEKFRPAAEEVVAKRLEYLARGKA